VWPRSRSGAGPSSAEQAREGWAAYLAVTRSTRRFPYSAPRRTSTVTTGVLLRNRAARLATRPRYQEREEERPTDVGAARLTAEQGGDQGQGLTIEGPAAFRARRRTNPQGQVDNTGAG
jgi:hypothetical protein